jgi:hypothetical protein
MDGGDLAECGLAMDGWKRSSRVWIRSNRVWIRSSRVIRAPGCQCQSCHSPGFGPSILRHTGISGAADEAVLNNVHKKEKKSQKFPKNPKKSLFIPQWPIQKITA